MSVSSAVTKLFRPCELWLKWPSWWRKVYFLGILLGLVRVYSYKCTLISLVIYQNFESQIIRHAETWVCCLVCSWYLVPQFLSYDSDPYKVCSCPQMGIHGQWISSFSYLRDLHSKLLPQYVPVEADWPCFCSRKRYSRAWRSNWGKWAIRNFGGISW